jgi:hypothetical protein
LEKRKRVIIAKKNRGEKTKEKESYGREGFLTAAYFADFNGLKFRDAARRSKAAERAARNLAEGIVAPLVDKEGGIPLEEYEARVESILESALLNAEKEINLKSKSREAAKEIEEE